MEDKNIHDNKPISYNDNIREYIYHKSNKKDNLPENETTKCILLIEIFGFKYTINTDM